MGESIIDISHSFFDEIVRPILTEHFPVELNQAAIGIFGYGSEVLRLDDELSSDHHWGLRIDALFPDALFRAKGHEIKRVVSANLPHSYRGTRCARRTSLVQGWHPKAQPPISPA